MSQRDSGYARKDNDLYETPGWVTESLLPHIPRNLEIWEPAAGSGKMADVLADAGHKVWATDISDSNGADFLQTIDHRWDAIVTNPPYEFATNFIEHALKMTNVVAMLLRCDFDSAKTRQHLFGQCEFFNKKIVLTKRIRWIDGSTGSPSFNHAWFIWDHQYRGAPTLAYGP